MQVVETDPQSRTRLITPIGTIEYDRPKVAYSPDFKSQFHVPHMGRPEKHTTGVIDKYVNGVCTHKVKDPSRAEVGDKADFHGRRWREQRRRLVQGTRRSETNVDANVLRLHK